MNTERSLVIAGYVSLLLALCNILLTPPANGYEPSIYWSLPIYFWVFIIISLFIAICSISLSLKKGFLDGVDNDKLWMYGVILLFLVYLIVLFLPTIRGYPFGDIDAMNDTFAHLAHVEYILENGCIFPLGDSYISCHLFIVVVVLFGITIPQTINFSPSILLIALLLFSLIFGGSLSLDRKFRILIFFTSIPILFSGFTRVIQPSLQITYFFVLFFYLYNRANKNEISTKFKWLSIVVFSFIIFYHPLSSLILIIFLIIYVATKYVYSRINKGVVNIGEDLNYIVTIVSIYITCIIYQMLMLGSIREFYNRFTGIENDYGDTTSAVISVAKENKDFLEIFDGFIKIYGHQALYLAVALICAIIIYASFIRGKNKVSLYELVYSNLFMVGIVIAAFLMTGILVSETLRVINYALILAPILIGIVFYHIMNQSLSLNTRKALLICLIIMVCFASFIGIFRIYNDAWFGNKNTQFTSEDYYGMSWFIKESKVNRLQNIYEPFPVITNNYPSYVFRLFYFKNPQYPFKYRLSEQKLNPHFLYDKNPIIGKISSYECQYMITYDKMKVATANIPEDKLDRVQNDIFTESDFYRLSIDPSVNKIYTNSGFEEWMIFKVN